MSKCFYEIKSLKVIPPTSLTEAIREAINFANATDCIVQFTYNRRKIEIYPNELETEKAIKKMINDYQKNVGV